MSTLRTVSGRKGATLHLPLTLPRADRFSPRCTDHFSNVFPPVTVNFDLMTLTFELGLDDVKMNRRAKVQRSLRSKVIVRSPDTQTHAHTGPIALTGSLNWSGPCPPSRTVPALRASKARYVEFVPRATSPWHIAPVSLNFLRVNF